LAEPVDAASINRPTGLPVLRGFSRNAKQDSEGSEASGGMRRSRMLAGEQNSAPNLSTLLRKTGSISRGLPGFLIHEWVLNPPQTLPLPVRELRAQVVTNCPHSPVPRGFAAGQFIMQTNSISRSLLRFLFSVTGSEPTPNDFPLAVISCNVCDNRTVANITCIPVQNAAKENNFTAHCIDRNLRTANGRLLKSLRKSPIDVPRGTLRLSNIFKIFK
jgi:hypothetical protein